MSNVFSRLDQFSRELRERILAAARELGSPGPDRMSQTVRRGRAGAVGLITHEPLRHLFEDPAARLTMAGVARICGEHGSALVLVPRAEAGVPDVVATARVDGFVAFCDPLEPERRETLRARRLPVVGLDAPVAPGEPYVGIDHRAAARAAAAHLVDLGHRRIGVISLAPARGAEAAVAPAGVDAPMGSITNRARLDGYRDALRPVLADGGRVVVVAARGAEEADGAAATGMLLDLAGPRPMLAMRRAGARRRRATCRGIRVPGGLSVVGFDDVPAAAAATPPLTTVRQPHARKGAEAVRIFLRPALTRAALIWRPRSSSGLDGAAGAWADAGRHRRRVVRAAVRRAMPNSKARSRSPPRLKAPASSMLMKPFAQAVNSAGGLQRVVRPGELGGDPQHGGARRASDARLGRSPRDRGEDQPEAGRTLVRERAEGARQLAEVPTGSPLPATALSRSPRSSTVASATSRIRASRLRTRL